MGDMDPNNTTLFVGGLSQGVMEPELRSVFEPYGEMVYCRIPPNGKGIGFVQFHERVCAENALREVNGMVLQGFACRVSWGKSVRRSDGPPRNSGPSHHHPPHSGPYLGAGAYGGYHRGPHGGGYGPPPHEYGKYGDPRGGGGYGGHMPYAPPPQQHHHMPAPVPIVSAPVTPPTDPMVGRPTEELNAGFHSLAAPPLVGYPFLPSSI